MTFDNFKKQSKSDLAYRLARQMAENPGRPAWLTMLGGNGTGKTHLGIAVCRKWIQAGVASRYALVSLLLDELREGFRLNDGAEYTNRFHYYCEVPLLMLDDLGLESKTAWVQEKLETIVDYRLMHGLSMIVTSNDTMDDLQPRIRSRLMRQGDIVETGDDDYAMRRKK